MKTSTYDETKFALVPREANLENKMKPKFMGAFVFGVNVGSFPDYKPVDVIVPWNVIANIYKEMVAFNDWIFWFYRKQVRVGWFCSDDCATLIARLCKGTVVDFTNKKVRIEYYNDWNFKNSGLTCEYLQDANQLVKVAAKNNEEKANG